MARQYYGGPITPIPNAVGTALTTTTATDISKAPQPTIGANQLEVGSVITIIAGGIFSTAASTPGTLTLGVYYGGIAGLALATGGAITPTVSAASWPWRIEYTGVVTATGTAGTIEGQGFLQLGTSLTAFSITPIPVTAPAAVTIDTTTAKALTIGATWSTAPAGDSITLRHYVPQILN